MGCQKMSSHNPFLPWLCVTSRGRGRRDQALSTPYWRVEVEQQISGACAVTIAPTMATVLGVSSCVRLVREKVRRIVPEAQVENIDTLGCLLAERQQELKRRKEQLETALSGEAEDTLARCAGALSEVETLKRQRLAPLEAALDAAKTTTERGNSGVIRRCVSHVARATRRWLYRQQLQRIEAAYDADRKDTEARVERAERIRQDPGEEAERRLAPELRRLEQLESVSRGSDARGAVGELVVARHLDRLPDGFWVFHDVRLRARSFLRFRGKPVQAAQVDHLVVGPTGVYLIETKSWSVAFAKGGDYFDPFEQVGRAGLLCHCLLSGARLPSRVRNVIATHTRLRHTAAKSYTKVVAPPNLARFVMAGRADLNTREVSELAAFFKRNTAS